MQVRLRVGVLCLFAVVACSNAFAEKLFPTIINGQPADVSAWAEVVNIEIELPNSRTALCSATIVGSKVLVTAAHCGATGATAKFKYKGTNYTGKMTRSSLYPDRDHDLAVVVTSTAISSPVARTVGGKSTRGSSVDILGYGCTTATGSSDGVLRIGQTVINGFSGFYMVTSSPEGATACRGDSGGPAFIVEGTKKLLVGINALSNGQDMSYHTRLDVPESQNFLLEVATNNSVDICGINGVQCSDVVDPDDETPSCVLTASPSSVKLGDKVTLTMTSTNATSATIDGVAVRPPTATHVITPSSLGKKTAQADVRGPGGFGSCLATYEVTNGGGGGGGDRPTCSLTAIPKEAAPNQAVTLEIATFNAAEFASIEGTSVSVPVGRLTMKKANPGDYAVSGFVRNANGSFNCFTDFRVSNGPITPPAVPDYAVTPTHCGPNLLASSGVSTVCLAVVKKPESMDKLAWNQVVQIGNADGSVEVLPIVGVRTSGLEQTLALYANQSVASQNFRVLDTKTATLTMSSGNVPQSIEGRSARGRYFVVDSLTSPSVVAAMAKAPKKK